MHIERSLRMKKKHYIYKNQWSNFCTFHMFSALPLFLPYHHLLCVKHDMAAVYKQYITIFSLYRLSSDAETRDQMGNRENKRRNCIRFFIYYRTQMEKAAIISDPYGFLNCVPSFPRQITSRHSVERRSCSSKFMDKNKRRQWPAGRGRM